MPNARQYAKMTAMGWNFLFFANSILLGVGLAMDAFSVSIVNAIAEPDMRRRRQCAIAGVYALFQFAMPMAGWICVRQLALAFTAFQKFIPWTALVLLSFIGAKMIWESASSQKEKCKGCKKSSCASCEENKRAPASPAVLLLQGVATSIDALSVGFTIAEYGPLLAATASLIIALVTFAICMTGLLIGKAAGQKLTFRAQTVGGCILIFIGLEIFIRGALL